MNDTLPYFSVFSLAFVINFIASKDNNKLFRNILPIFSFLILVCFIGFRQNVGTDYGAYAATYLSVRGMNWQDIFLLRLEPFVGILYKAFSNVFNDYHWIFFMYGAMSLLPIYIANKLYENKYLAFSVLAYCMVFLPFSLNGMRQGVAISFIILGFIALIKKKKKTTILSFVFAILFHKTAIVVAPFYIIGFLIKKQKTKTEKKELVYYLLIAFVMVLSMVTFLKNFLDENELGSYGVYLTNMSYQNLSFASIVTFLPVLVTILLMNKKFVKPLDETTKLNNIFYIGMIFQVVGTLAQYVNRIALYFLPSMIFIIPIFLESIKNPAARFIIKIMVFAYFVAYFVSQFIVFGYHDIIPYQTWI